MNQINIKIYIDIDIIMESLYTTQIQEHAVSITG